MTSPLTRRRLERLGWALMAIGLTGVIGAWIEPDDAQMFYALGTLMIVLGIYCRIAARML